MVESKRALQLALVLPLALAACTITDEEQGTKMSLQHSYGSVVHGDFDHVWSVAQDTMAQVASGVSVDSESRRVGGQWNEASVSVQVQKKAPMETILRVSAQKDGVERQDIAERLQIAIQQALIGY